MQASSSWKCTDCSKDPHPPPPLLRVFVFELGQAILDSHRRHPHRQDTRKAPEDIASEASDKLFDSGSVSPSAKKLAAARQGIVEVSLCTPASFSGTASCRGAFWHTPGQGRTSERWLVEVRRGREHLPLRTHKDSKQACFRMIIQWEVALTNDSSLGFGGNTLAGSRPMLFPRTTSTAEVAAKLIQALLSHPTYKSSRKSQLHDTARC